MTAKRILVVDDDDDIRVFLRDLLELEGFAVDTAADGDAALEGVAVSAPDCVLLDVMMPGADGLTVLEGIRSSELGLSLPVVMLTARTDDESQWRAWTGGADYFFAKPLDAPALLAYLNALFHEDADRSSALLR